MSFLTQERINVSRPIEDERIFSDPLSGLLFGQGFHMDRPKKLDGFGPVLKKIALDQLYLDPV